VPDAIIEVAVSSKSLGEALGEKVYFYADIGIKDYLVIQAFPEKPVRLWFCRPNLGELPNPVGEAVLETLGVKIVAQGQKIRMFNSEGNEIVPLREVLEREWQQREQERRQWKEVEQQLIEALEQERRKREELERRVAELEQKLKANKS
jgi:hypothetical protein